MQRTIRATIAVILVLIIMVCAITIFQHLTKGMRADVTEQKIYTLSQGTKNILAKLNQPIDMKLYYAKTAAMKGTDQIRYYNNYYYFVRALLEEYEKAAKGMVNLEIIDPRPYSDEEVEALQYGLKRFNITEDEGFFFGLVVQTQFGVEKTIPFFTPDRQNFIEYDISNLIDNAIMKQKKRIGVMSSLPVTGEDVSGYMAQMMRMQGQEPEQPWTFITQIEQKYEVEKIATDINSINDMNDIDMLLVIHPKDLPDKTLFAIDQYVMNGGRMIVAIDPHCMADKPKNQQQMYMQQQHSTASNLNKLLNAWGLNMPEQTFAGDRGMALTVPLRQNQRPEKMIAFLGLDDEAFSDESVITANLADVKMLFAGVLKETVAADPNAAISRMPLVSTSSRGNSWTISSPYELMMPDPDRLMDKFYDGTEPVHMGYLLTGTFPSAFNGTITVPSDDPNEAPETITGLKQSTSDPAVVVFSDVDFITDMLAYNKSFFGTMVVGDNAALMQNAIDELGGSADLISIRSRGSFKRPFEKVELIEQQAEKATKEEEEKIQAEIDKFQQDLNNLLSQAKQGQEDVIGSAIVQQQREIELKIHNARKELREVKKQRREEIDKLGAKLQRLNTLPGPAITLLLAIIIGGYRVMRKRHYVSHASDS